ncbi:DNAse I-like superfamily protein [Prunus dulcis]|uniref:DNAse I-like superfamily protein n=1 Tax=Prunus dulcis TaxID=3755 RepID=A0A4Y1QY33_PRUDU|nr:DNAse I-like superfamily protein [Prunus dulcis]
MDKISSSSVNVKASSNSEPQSNPTVDIQSVSSTEPQMPAGQYVQSFRVFVATWNVGGKSPHNGLNLDDFLHEIVPLNAGNVLVLEDNEPAAKWLTLINQSLNKSLDGSSRSKASGSRFSSKPSLKKVSKTFRTESKRRLKSCNCIFELERKHSKDYCFRCQQPNINEEDLSSEPDEDGSNVFDISEISMASTSNHLKYSLIASKQMVGIFVTIWARKEHIQYVSHLRISCISRGIMGYLGNKTSFCFVCSHLASGEKEGDELRRNLDVLEILKSTQFPKICKTTHSRMPDKILGHDSRLKEKQSECDRILWHGSGIKQLSYIRGESQFSDHRPVCGTFVVDVVVNQNELKKGSPSSNMKIEIEELLPTARYLKNIHSSSLGLNSVKKNGAHDIKCLIHKPPDILFFKQHLNVGSGGDEKHMASVSH